MPLVAVSTLIARARAMADIRDNFVPTGTWEDWASQERFSLELFLARSGYTTGFQSALITVNGTEGGLFELPTYQNPGDPHELMAIIGVWEVNTSGMTRRLKRSDEISFLRQVPGSTNLPTGHSQEYRIFYSQGFNSLNLNFYPEPSVGETYMFSYIQAPLKLAVNILTTDQEDYVTYPMGWEERIVLGMAKRALIREESDTTAIEREIAEIDRRIEEHIWDTQLAETAVIRNVDRETYGWNQKIIFPQPTYWWWA